MKKQLIGFVSLFIILTMIMNALPTAGYSENMQRTTVLSQADRDNDTAPLGPDWYHKPTSIAQLITWYQALEAQYPQFLELFKANELYGTGTITGGYDDYYLRITNEYTGFHKPEVLFLGNPHGDETVGTIGQYWFVDWLMRMAFTDEPCPDYSKDWLRWLIDNREIYIEVSHNPWGYDHQDRYDANGWDLNREADMDGPGYPTGGIWASVQGRTLYRFVDNHTIRLALDWHGGARLLLYPWGSTHASVHGTSPITGYTYDYAPPDFYFFDASSLRLGDYIGDYGGDLDKYSIGTIPGTVGYVVNGGMSPWAYGGDVETNPVEDPYVHDETYGNYPGAGILWISPEMSNTKNPSESAFGNDTVPRYGAEVRRIILHQTDFAQPNIQLQGGTIGNGSIVNPGDSIPIKWMVNGSLVVDHTSIQWGSNADPIQHPEYLTPDHDEHNGSWVGGTGWDEAESGQTQGTVYSENITIPTSGDYYFVVKAMVDQKYAAVLHPEVYHNNPYLRLVKERTNASYHEEIDGSDGLETINGQLWWYSPIIHVTTAGSPPAKPSAPVGQMRGKVGLEYNYTTSTTDPDTNESLYYYWNWGDGTFTNWTGPYLSGENATANHTWAKKGTYNVTVKAKDKYNLESDWSDPSIVKMPFIPQHRFLDWLFAHFPNAFPILRYLFGQ